MDTLIDFCQTYLISFAHCSWIIPETFNFLVRFLVNLSDSLCSLTDYHLLMDDFLSISDSFHNIQLKNFLIVPKYIINLVIRLKMIFFYSQEVQTTNFRNDVVIFQGKSMLIILLLHPGETTAYPNFVNSTISSTCRKTVVLSCVLILDDH